MKSDFLQKTEKYVNLFKPKYYMPFAGRYTLTGKLSMLNVDKGVSSLDEAFDYLTSSKNIDHKKYHCFLLNSKSSFNIDTGEPSRPYSSIDTDAQKKYIENVLSKRKLDYEYEVEPSDEELLSLIPKAFERFESKRKEIGFESDTTILIKISDEKFLALSCNGNGYEIISAKESEQIKKYVEISTDRKLLKWLLTGPKCAYWGTAENGSHLQFKRDPNIYERGLYYSLSFFHL